MNLREYLQTLPNGGQAQFAGRIQVSPAYLSQLSNGFRDAGIEVAARIERETGGAVSVQEIRPDVDWNLLRSSGDTPEAAPEQAAG